MAVPGTARLVHAEGIPPLGGRLHLGSFLKVPEPHTWDPVLRGTEPFPVLPPQQFYGGRSQGSMPLASKNQHFSFAVQETPQPRRLCPSPGPPHTNPIQRPDGHGPSNLRAAHPSPATSPFGRKHRPKTVTSLW